MPERDLIGAIGGSGRRRLGQKEGEGGMIGSAKSFHSREQDADTWED